MELVARLPKSLADFVSRPGNDAVDVSDGVRVADAAEADIALAHLARAFELHAHDVGGNEARTGDSRRSVVELLIAAMRHIEHAAGDKFLVRVRALVHRMAGYRGDRAALLRIHRGNLDVLLRDFAEHGFFAAIRLGTE